MNPEMVATLRRAEESAKALKTTSNYVSDPTMASHLDIILDSCSIGLSILVPAESSNSPHSNKKSSRGEAFKQYRDDSLTPIVDDCFFWRKYGQKTISNSPYKRSYYQCRYGNCEAKKQMQKIQDNPPVFRTTYVGEHTCKNVAVSSVPVMNSNMNQFDSHDEEAMTIDRQENVDQKEQFFGVDFPALTEEEMKFFDDIFV